MTTNRRTFLASLFALPCAIRASVARAAAAPATILRGRYMYVLKPSDFKQVTRTTVCHNPEYVAAIEKILKENPHAFSRLL